MCRVVSAWRSPNANLSANKGRSEITGPRGSQTAFQQSKGVQRGHDLPTQRFKSSPFPGKERRCAFSRSGVVQGSQRRFVSSENQTHRPCFDFVLDSRWREVERDSAAPKWWAGVRTIGADPEDSPASDVDGETFLSAIPRSVSRGGEVKTDWCRVPYSPPDGDLFAGARGMVSGLVAGTRFAQSDAVRERKRMRAGRCGHVV